MRTGQFTHLQEIMQRPLPRTWDVVFDSETQEDKLLAQVGCCQDLCCNVLLAGGDSHVPCLPCVELGLPRCLLLKTAPPALPPA